MKNKVALFDFDGTIADTRKYLIEISNRISDEFNFKKIKPEEAEDLKDKTSQEMIKHLRVPVLKIPAILAKAKSEFYKGISSIHPARGLKEILHQLKNTNITMGILSSNSPKNINQFLTNHELLNIFDFVHGTSKVWSKNTSLKKLMQKNGYEKDHILYIGDETRDIIAAKRLGIKVIAVAWGYNSTKLLKSYNPDYFVQDPKELLDIL